MNDKIEKLSLDLEKFKKFAQEQQRKIREHLAEVEKELKTYHETGTFTEMICRGKSGRFNCGETSKSKKSIIGVVITLEDGTFLKFGVVCPYANSEICILEDYDMKRKKEEL
jgi:hypothetical protein